MSARDAIGRLNKAHKASRESGVPPVRRDPGMPAWPKDAFDPEITIPPNGPAVRACALWPECDCDTCHLDHGDTSGKTERVAYGIILLLAFVGIVLALGLR